MFPFFLGSLQDDDVRVAIAINLFSIAALFAVGLCGLWISLGKRLNWQLRGILILLVLAPLVAIPAYDLFVAFWVQALLAAALTAPLRSRLQMNSEATVKSAIPAESGSARVFKGWWPRYSLADLLACFAFFAVLFGAASQIKFQWINEWIDLLTYAPAAAIITAGAAYGGLARRRRWLWIPLLAATSWCIGWCLFRPFISLNQPTFPGIWLFHNGWHKEFDLKGILFWFAFVLASWLAILRYVRDYWSGQVPGILAAQSSTDGRRVGWRQRASGRLATILVAGTSIALFVPLAWLYWRMLNPLPIPPSTIDPNPYRILKTTGKSLEFGPDDFENATIEDVRAFITRNAAPLAQAHDLVRCDSQVDDEYYATEWEEYYSAWELSAVARALELEGHLLRAKGELEQAANTFLDIMWLAQIALRDGDIGHCVGSTSIEGTGRDNLLTMRKDWSPDDCRIIIRKLRNLDQQRVSTDDMLMFTRIHWEHGEGWKWRLHSIFFGLPITNIDEHDWSRPYFLLAAIAKTRLLMVDLAIQAYQEENNDLPDTLETLVPEYLPSMPLDPFTFRPLTYVRSDEGYLVYSVGYDEIDNGGLSIDDAIKSKMEEFDVFLELDRPWAKQYQPGFVLPGATRADGCP